MFKRAYIANTVTAMNIVSGFISILYAFEGNYFLAAVWIFVATIFDLADGIVARMLKTSSEFGVQLDSIADVVSFGAAPAILIYVSYLHQLGTIGVLLSLCLLLFGAFRLARFNVQLEEFHKKEDFSGLPIPLSAATVATLVISMTENGNIIHPYDYYVIPLIILLSILMVSKIRYNALPRVHKDMFKEKPIYLGLILIALVLLIITDGSALFYLLLTIILFGIFRHFFLFLFHKDQKEVKPEKIN